MGDSKIRVTAPSLLRVEVARTFALAWPVVLTQVGTVSMSLVDLAMVAPLGADAIGAVGIGSSAFWLAATILFGVLLALDPLISQAWGAGERSRVGALAWQGGYIGIIGGAIACLCCLDTRALFDFVEQPAEVARLADQYLFGLSAGFIPFFVFVTGRSLLSGMSIVRPVMVIILIANGFNVVADYALIRGEFGLPALGVYGAGLATTTTRWMMTAMLLLYVASLKVGLDLRPRLPDLSRLRRIFSLGLPIGLQNFAEFGVFSAAGVFAGWLGATALAAHQVALNLVSFAFMVPVGVSVAVAVRVGHEIGAGNPDGAALAGRVGIAIGAGFMALSGIVFLSVPEVLAAAIGADGDVFALATQLLRIAAAFQIADGIQVVAAGALRGAGDTRSSMVANLVAHWCFGLPLGYVLAFKIDLGVVGLWWGLTGSLVFAAVLLLRLFLRGGWRRIGRVHA